MLREAVKASLVVCKSRLDKHLSSMVIVDSALGEADRLNSFPFMCLLILFSINPRIKAKKKKKKQH